MLVDALQGTDASDPSNDTFVISAGIQLVLVFYAYYQNANGADSVVNYDTGGANQTMTYEADWDVVDASNGSVWHCGLASLVSPTNTGSVDISVDLSGTGSVFHGGLYVATFSAIDTGTPLGTPTVGEQVSASAGSTAAITTTGEADHLIGVFIGDVVDVTLAGQTVRQTQTSDGATSALVTLDAPADGTDTLDYDNLRDGSWVAVYVNESAGGGVTIPQGFGFGYGANDLNGLLQT